LFYDIITSDIIPARKNRWWWMERRESSYR